MNNLRQISISFIILMIVVSASAFAAERIGDLLFETMKKIENKQRDFDESVSKIRTEREAAIKEKESVRKKFVDSKEGTMDRNEAHAEYSYALAKVYSATFSELKLVRETSGDHIKALNSLRNNLKGGVGGAPPEITRKIVKGTKGFLISSNSLLKSISVYKDTITDPVIKQKLDSTYSSALILEDYIKRLENDQTNTGTTQQTLILKVEELIGNLEQMHIESGMLMDMIKDRSNMLKMINEIAISELFTSRISSGKSFKAISDDVLKPLKEKIKDTDRDLSDLTNGTKDPMSPQTTPVRSWSEGFTIR